MDDLNHKHKELFKAWYVEPLSMLSSNINAGFIAMIVAFALYERLICAKLKLNNQVTEGDSVRSAMADDLGLDSKQQSIFWDLFRNGLLHGAMPKAGQTGYILHPNFSETPEFKTYKGNPVVCIDPWKFAQRTINQFLKDPDLIAVSESFPMAKVEEIDF